MKNPLSVGRDCSTAKIVVGVDQCDGCQFTEFGKPRSVEVTKLLPGDGKRHSDPEEEALSDEVALIIISPATYERLESTVSIISWSRLDPRRPC